MKIAVVILNYNGKTHLETYLPSVVKYSRKAEIIIADNASSDDSVGFIKKNYPALKLIINKENGGFAQGYNDALKHVNADWYVLLNSDVEVSQNWITPIQKFIETHPNVAAIQPKILAYNNKDHFEHAGAAGGFIDKNGYPFCRGRIFNHREKDEGQYDDPVRVFWATGACMFVKADLFHKAGGFDKDFFAHMEEIDLCWRMQRMGYEIWCIPQSKVYHLGGGTLNYMSPRKTYLNFRNNLMMIHKNYEGALFLKSLYRLILDGLAGGKFLFGGQFNHLWAICRAHNYYILNLKTLNKKRKKVRESGNHKPDLIIQKNIIFQFFLFKKKTYQQIMKDN